MKDEVGRRGGGNKPSTTSLILPSGDYYLPDDPGALLRYEPGAIACSKAQYDELWRFGEVKVPPSPNPLNRNNNLRRKQATFGAVYKFGAQVSMRVEEPEESWPELVRTAIRDSQSRIAPPERRGLFCQAHVNWYPDGRAGMGRHRDAEPDLEPGAPIFSYSFLSDGVVLYGDDDETGDDTRASSSSSPSPAGCTPRLFDVYRLGAKKPIATVPLGHGDVLVMAGSMQKTHEHGVRVSAAKAHAQQSRINITVRAFKLDSEAVSSGKGRGEAREDHLYPIPRPSAGDDD